MSCRHERRIEVCTKSRDSNFIVLGDEEHDGYVPTHINIGGGDYLKFTYCADCGYILSGVWPLPQNLVLSEED